MPALYDILVVLENDFDESSVISAHYRSILVNSSTVWPVRNAPDPENSSYFEEIGDLQGSICRDKWHAIDGVSLLPVDKPGGVRQYNGTGCADETIVIRPLWVRPRPTGCKICPAFIEILEILALTIYLLIFLNLATVFWNEFGNSWLLHNVRIKKF